MLKSVKVPEFIQHMAHPITVFIIGAGGTGSQLLVQLGRVHTALKAMNKMGLMVWLVDDDIVSEANLGRQTFSACDIGRYKCEVLIERVNRFFGTVWAADIRKINPAVLANDSLSGNIVVTCTDNVQSRQLIKEHIAFNRLKQGSWHEAFRNYFWIDTGNKKRTGQVIAGSLALDLPDVIDLYPDIEDHEQKDDTPSCSLMEALSKQDLFINTIVAEVTAMLIRDICTQQNLNWFGAYINLDGQSMVNKRVIYEEQIEIQGEDRSKRRDHRTETARAGKKSKGNAARTVRRGAKRRQSKADSNEKVLLLHGKQAGKVPGNDKTRAA
jgi:PRTRC genetic system ThiF family protein